MVKSGQHTKTQQIVCMPWNKGEIYILNLENGHVPKYGDVADTRNRRA